MEKQIKLPRLIPERVCFKYKGNIVVEAGWDVDPFFIVRKTNKYISAVLLEETCNWLEEYRHIFKTCYLLLLDKSMIRLYRNSFNRYDPDDSELKDSGTFIKVGKKSVNISERLCLSEEIIEGEYIN